MGITILGHLRWMHTIPRETYPPASQALSRRHASPWPRRSAICSEGSWSSVGEGGGGQTCCTISFSRDQPPPAVPASSRDYDDTKTRVAEGCTEASRGK